METKRLLIYLLMVFAVSLLLLLLWKPFGKSQTLYFVIEIFWCCTPALASLLTRKLTSEGFQDLKLHLNLRGNFRCYLLALLVPMVAVFSGIILVAAVNHQPLLAEGINILDILTAVCMLCLQAAVFSFVGVGEELGWRGYMNQKLEMLFGTLGACIIGGFLWGLWHVPNDLVGYLNGYGTLSETLFIGVERTLLLTCLGVLLIWLTKKTNSVWPAVIGHITYNASLEFGSQLFGDAESMANASISNWPELIPFVVMAVVFLVGMRKDSGDV